MQNEMRRELKKMIANIIEVDDFNDDDDFFAQLGVDSMIALEIMARTERRYRIRIPEESFTQMKNFNDVVRILYEIMLPVSR